MFDYEFPSTTGCIFSRDLLELECFQDACIQCVNAQYTINVESDWLYVIDGASDSSLV